MMKFAILKESFTVRQLDEIFIECGVPRNNVRLYDCMADVDLDAADVLVIPMDCCNVFGMLNGGNTMRVPEFVRRGGICWVMHQEREGWDGSWMPAKLTEHLHIDLKYLPKIVSFRRNTPAMSAYVGPWFTDRDHPVFHKPNFLDESDFAEWRIEYEERIFSTVALNAITRHDNWEKIAGYEDFRTPLEEGALIMRSEWGKGLYFWSQILSPSMVWMMENSREKDTWRKLIENIFRYFEDFKNGNLVKFHSRIAPWSVMSGETATLAVEWEGDFVPQDAKLSLNGETLRNSVFRFSGNRAEADVKVENTGTHGIRLELSDRRGKSICADQALKVSGEIYRCRFTTHHHYGTEWVPENLGQVSGSARRWKIDAVFLASGLFYQSMERYQVIDEKKLEMIDHPAVRIFPGQEVHPHHQYGRDEGNSDVSADSRRHLATMGCRTLLFGANLFEENCIAEIHKENALAIVAHPNPGDPWWCVPHNGHMPDGVCLDTGCFADWDRLLLRGKLFPAIRGSDSGPGEWSGGNANTAFLREPLTMRALMKAALNGRISFLYPRPGDFSTADSFLWFDLCGQRMGGDVYAADRVSLHVTTRSHLDYEHLDIIFNGETHRVVPVEGKHLELNLPEELTEDGYFRIELHSRGYREAHPAAWSNPIYVRRIEAPSGAAAFFDMDFNFRFDPSEGRFVPNRANIVSSEFKGGLWRMTLRQPEAHGVLRLTGIQARRILLDGKEFPAEELLISHGGGEHRLEIYLNR